MKASLLILHHDETSAAGASTLVAQLKSDATAVGAPLIEVMGDPSTIGDGNGSDNGMVVFVAGTPTGDELKTACNKLRDQGFGVIMVIDALTLGSGVDEAVKSLTDDKNLFQVTVAGAFKGLVRSKHPFLYAYPKSDCTSTVAVIFKSKTAKQKVLAIKRGRAPFKGMDALPGGFLNPHQETLRQCAKRELREETGLDLPEERFVLVDERSEPGRDPRGHIIDHGYVVYVEEDEAEAVLAQLHAGDDAESYQLIETDTLLAQGMAFDHAVLLKKVVA